MRVLVVDDDPTTRAVVRRVVSKALHFETDEATNGLECLEALRKRHYALVVLDLQMPVVGGLHALKAIRTDPALAHTPVVVLTGGAAEENVRVALSLGVAAFLTKPINPEQLAARFLHVAESQLPPGHQPDQPGDTAVVFCGPDAEFRGRVAPCLATEATVVEVESAEALLECLAHAHESWDLRVVLCATPADADLRADLVERVRALPDGEDIALFVSVPRDEVAAARRSILWDGVLSSAMPPVMWASQFARLHATALETRQALSLGTAAIG